MTKSTVLVTGANRGIGEAFVRHYANAGCRVHACCRVPEKAAALRDTAKSGDVVLHRLDVTDIGSIHDLVAAIDDEPIDILINNAGIAGAGPQSFGHTDYDDWELVLHTNVIGPYRIAEALADRVAASDMKRIANISSGMASLADNRSGGSYAYRSSKAALNMIVVNLAHDLAERGISVIVLCPGWVITDMGGPGAELTADEAVTGMSRVIAGADLAHSGRFYHHEGHLFPW